MADEARLAESVRLLHAAYDVLRSVEKYGDWDVNFYEQAVATKEAIGEYLWPDGHTG